MSELFHLPRAYWDRDFQAFAEQELASCAAAGVDSDGKLVLGKLRKKVLGARGKLVYGARATLAVVDA